MMKEDEVKFIKVLLQGDRDQRFAAGRAVGRAMGRIMRDHDSNRRQSLDQILRIFSGEFVFELGDEARLFVEGIECVVTGYTRDWEQNLQLLSTIDYIRKRQKVHDLLKKIDSEENGIKDTNLDEDELQLAIMLEEIHVIRRGQGQRFRLDLIASKALNQIFEDNMATAITNAINGIELGQELGQEDIREWIMGLPGPDDPEIA